jgi:hypothetical protein
VNLAASCANQKKLFGGFFGQSTAEQGKDLRGLELVIASISKIEGGQGGVGLTDFKKSLDNALMFLKVAPTASKTSRKFGGN